MRIPSVSDMAIPFERQFDRTRALVPTTTTTTATTTTTQPFSFAQGLFYTPKHNREEFEALPRGSFIATPDEGGGGVVDIGPASDETVVRVNLDAAGVVQRIQVVPAVGGGEGKHDEETKEQGHHDLSDLLAVPANTGGGGAHETPSRGPSPGDVGAHVIYPAKHHVVGRGEMDSVVSAIKEEMEERCSQLGLDGKVLEAERLRQRTENDLLLLDAVGTCKVDAFILAFAFRRFSVFLPRHTLSCAVLLSSWPGFYCSAVNHQQQAPPTSLFFPDLANPPLGTLSAKKQALSRPHKPLVPLPPHLPL